MSVAFKTPQALNIEICEALGLPTENLVRVQVDLLPFEVPTVTAVYQILDARAFGQVRTFTLNPKEA